MVSKKGQIYNQFKPIWETIRLDIPNNSDKRYIDSYVGLEGDDSIIKDLKRERFYKMLTRGTTYNLMISALKSLKSISTDIQIDDLINLIFQFNEN